MSEPQGFRPPRENLYRGVPPTVEALEVRASADQGPPTLFGHFARFNEWTEIDSHREGHFMERIAPGAFADSFARVTPKIQFNHGQHVGSLDNPVIAAPVTVREDEHGAYYEAPLLEGVPPLLLSGLRAGAYGASFRFSVDAEDIDRAPTRSAHNPDGLPERTVTAASVSEAGPVTWPAYAGATSGVRSMTDVFHPTTVDEEIERLARDKPGELAKRIERVLRQEDAASDTGSGEAPAARQQTPEPESEPDPAPIQADATAPAAQREETTVSEEALNEYRTKDQKAARIGELKSEIVTIHEANAGVLSTEDQKRWDAADAEINRVTADLAAQEARDARLIQLGTDEKHTEGPASATVLPFTSARTVDPFDKTEVYRSAHSPQEVESRFRDNAKRAVEMATFPHPMSNREDAQGHVETLLDTVDGPGEGKHQGELARRILTTGSPVYRRAFGKWLIAGNTDSLTNEERTVMAEGAGATGGFAINFQLDPTIVPTYNKITNPYRSVCRTVTISGTNEWRAVSSGAVVATYEAEATEAVDRSPTLAQPAFVTKRAQTFVPFSRELQQDWGALETEMARLIQDSKDILEGQQFATGVGTTVFPQGMVVGATNTATSGTTTVLAVGDIYKAEEALNTAFRAKAQWFANRFIYNKVRQLDTAGGANLWVQNLQFGLPNNEMGNTGYTLIGYPANEASGMAATLATTTKLAVLGDPNYYVIVDRIGMDIELIPNLFGGTAHYPTGQRALYALWRNTARVLDAAAFVTLVGL